VGGLGWGAGNVSLVLSGLIVIAVAALALTEGCQRRARRP